MVNLDELIELNRNNYYKLLVIIGDSPAKKKKIISYLKQKDWETHDVEKAIFDLISDIPKDKIHLRIGDKIKKWVKSLESKIILTNANILYSSEMDKIGPVEAFKYRMRNRDRQAILFLEKARLRDNKAIYSKPGRDDYLEMDLSKIAFAEIEDIIVGGIK